MPFLKMKGKMVPQLTQKVSLTMSLFILKTGKYILKTLKIVTHHMLFKKWKKTVSTLQRTRLTNQDLQILLDQRSMSILKIILERISENIIHRGVRCYWKAVDVPNVVRRSK